MRFRHLFVASKHNKFHPPLLRPLGLGIYALILLAVPFVYNVTTSQGAQVLGYATSISTGEIHALSNQQRAANGVAPLNLNGTLVAAAQAKAADMFANNYWAHVSPSGATPWNFINNSGYAYSAAGENLAKDFDTSSGVVTGWMNSSVHRENVLQSQFQDVGYAVMNGVLLGGQTTLVVAMYGSPQGGAPAAAAAPVPPAGTPQQTAPPAATTPEPVVTETPQSEVQASESPAAAAPSEKNKDDTAHAQAAMTEDQFIATIQEPLLSIPAVEGAFVAPVKAYSTLNWGQKASLVLLCLMALLFVMNHTIVWRQRKKGAKHIWLKAHPLAQASLLVVAGVATLISGVGVVL